MPPPSTVPVGPDPGVDRLAALRGWSAAQVAGLLNELPLLDEGLAGEGPLARRSRWGNVQRPPPGGPTLATLASIMGRPNAIAFSRAVLPRFDLQLVDLAAFHGGVIDRDQALAEVGNAHDDQLDEAAARLAHLLLSDPDLGFVALRPGVRELLHLPGLDLRDALNWVNSDQIAKMLRSVGVANPPGRKAERVDAYVAAMRDPETLTQLVGRLSSTARQGFTRLLTEVSLPVRDLGAGYYYPSQTRIREATPLHELLAAGLVGIDSERQRAIVWLDVLVALQGHLYADWDHPLDRPPTTPLSDPRGAFPPILGRLGALFDLWERDPPAALQTGGLGVRSVRSAAKSLGVPAGELGLGTHLAVRLGLLGYVETGTTGRGRNRVTTFAWRPTTTADEWEALPAPSRWVLLVHEWRALDDLDEGEGLPERWDQPQSSSWSRPARECFLRLLVGLPDGTGLAEADLVTFARNRHDLLDEATTRGLTTTARALGLVPTTGPVGLTTLGRAVLAGPDEVADVAADEAHQFTVQADQTVICPPDLAADVVARLERFVDLESDAGARIYRFSEARIGRALDSGETAASILAFLSEHSPTGVAQNIAHLLQDCERRHGRLRVGVAASYLHCDDPGLLARATSIKPAKLTILEPTVAVSTLAPTALLTALRKKGLMPVADGDDGTTGTAGNADQAEVQTLHGAPQRLPKPKPARRPLTPTDGEPPKGLVTLARRLVDAAPDPEEDGVDDGSAFDRDLSDEIPRLLRLLDLDEEDR